MSRPQARCHCQTCTADHWLSLSGLLEVAAGVVVLLLIGAALMVALAAALPAPQP
jgi:hypothetical protein